MEDEDEGGIFDDINAELSLPVDENETARAGFMFLEEERSAPRPDIVIDYKLRSELEKLLQGIENRIPSSSTDGNDRPKKRRKKKFNPMKDERFAVAGFDYATFCKTVEGMDENTRRLLSVSHQRENLAPETLEKMRLGRLHKTHTPETRIKIGLRAKKRVVTEETREKMRQSAKKRVVSEETREKMRQAKLGNKNAKKE